MYLDVRRNAQVEPAEIVTHRRQIVEAAAEKAGTHYLHQTPLRACILLKCWHQEPLLHTGLERGSADARIIRLAAWPVVSSLDTTTAGTLAAPPRVR